MNIVTIKDIVDSSEDRWGDAEDNYGRLVPFGIKDLDESMMGIPVQRGGVFGIQGTPGSRKTTFMLNIVMNQCLSGKLPPGYHVCIDTLESGMTIERYADILLAMLATKIMIYRFWMKDYEEDNVARLFNNYLPIYSQSPEAMAVKVGIVENDRFVRETVLRPEFFTYGRRTQRQQEAITLARSIIRTWPVMIFGFSEHPDFEISRARSTDVTNLDRSQSRWFNLSENYNMRELIVDHLQQYRFHGIINDYEVMKQVVGAVSNWQKQHRGVAWIISQIGVMSARESRQSGRDAHAQGGQVLEAESQVMWNVEYDKDQPYTMRLRRPIKSRIGMHRDLELPIEPNSGVFFADPLD